MIESPQNEHTYKKSKRYFTQVDKCNQQINKNQVEVWGKYPKIDIWLPICQSYHISRQLRAVALDAEPRTPSNRGNLKRVLACTGNRLTNLMRKVLETLACLNIASDCKGCSGSLSVFIDVIIWV